MPLTRSRPRVRTLRARTLRVLTLVAICLPSLLRAQPETRVGKSNPDRDSVILIAEASFAADTANSTALVELANAYYDGGHWYKARLAYARYLCRVPTDTNARGDYAYAIFKSDTSKGDLALREYDTALSHNPRFFNGLYNKGILYAKMHVKDRSVFSIEQSIALMEAALKEAKRSRPEEIEQLETYLAKLRDRLKNTKKS